MRIFSQQSVSTKVHSILLPCVAGMVGGREGGGGQSKLSGPAGVRIFSQQSVSTKVHSILLPCVAGMVGGRGGGGQSKLSQVQQA